MADIREFAGFWEVGACYAVICDESVRDLYYSPRGTCDRPPSLSLPARVEGVGGRGWARLAWAIQAMSAWSMMRDSVGTPTCLPSSRAMLTSSGERVTLRMVRSRWACLGMGTV